jgi:hypothetical protein
VNCVGGCFGHAEDAPLTPSRKAWMASLLKAWGFNTAGAWSSPSVWDAFYVTDRIYTDSGKDSGQKLTDVPYRRAAGPCNPSPATAIMHVRSTHHTAHRHHKDRGCLLNPWRPPRCNPLQIQREIRTLGAFTYL